MQDEQTNGDKQVFTNGMSYERGLFGKKISQIKFPEEHYARLHFELDDRLDNRTCLHEQCTELLSITIHPH